MIYEIDSGRLGKTYQTVRLSSSTGGRKSLRARRRAQRLLDAMRPD